MKTVTLLLVSSALTIALFVRAGYIKSNASIEYPEDVKKIIDNKCYKCHSDEGKSDDAKEALLWDKLPTLKKVDQIATLDDISEVLDEGKMPPEKVVEKYPNMKLTKAETKILLEWAESTAEKLLE